MLLKAVTVYDSKAQCYFQPFFVNSVGAAIRSFGDEANKSDGPIGKHPGDYQLYEIGNYDDSTGLLTALVPMRLLGTALDFIDIKNSLRADLAHANSTTIADIRQSMEVLNGSQKA